MGDHTVLNATQLAVRLGVSKARVSQYVSKGTLAGCYEGEGRSRLFDEAKCLQALRGGLDAGQMMGNGAQTKRTIVELQSQPSADDRRPQARGGATSLTATDPDRYELARIQKAEEEARRLRRQNAQEEGQFVLASEVERNVAKAMASEVAQFETVMRDAARAVADSLGVDFREVRKILMDQWRAHRARRTGEIMAEVEGSEMTEVEQKEDI